MPSRNVGERFSVGNPEISLTLNGGVAKFYLTIVKYSLIAQGHAFVNELPAFRGDFTRLVSSGACFSDYVSVSALQI